MEQFEPWRLNNGSIVEHRRGDPFVAAVSAARMPMLITDPRLPDNPIVFANEAFFRLTGYSCEDVAGRNCRLLQGPQTEIAAVAKIRDALANGRGIDIEVLNYRKDGSSFRNAVSIGPVFDEAGRVRYFFASQRDVDGHFEVPIREPDSPSATDDRRTIVELEAALAAKTLLLHEVDHRVKNNLQMISSLIILQSRRIGDPAVRRSMMAVQERVEALSLVHRRLYQADDASLFDVSEFVRELATELVATTGRTDIAINLQLDTSEIAAEKAAPIALILNELLVNALRHAFTAERPGTIRISVKQADARLELEIADDGVGMAAAAGKAPGPFGRTLVEALARQIRGEIDWHEQDPGTRVRLSVPLLHARRQPAT